MSSILFFHYTYFDPQKGGVERVSLILGEYFQTQGHKIYYLSWKRPGDLSHNHNSINHYYLPSENKISSKENISFIKLILKEKNIDIIINQSASKKIYFDLIFQAKSHQKIISVIHNQINMNREVFENSIRNNRIIKYLSKLRLFILIKFFTPLLANIYQQKYINFICLLVDNTDALVLLSSAYTTELRNIIRKSTPNVFVIPNPILKSYSTDPIKKEKHALYVGRLTYGQKRPDLLLKIWEKVMFYRKDWVLNIVGDGEYKEAMIEYVNKHNIQNVFFHGFKDPTTLYKSARIFCMTSAYEGFPMVLLEALQFKVVPIAFNTFGSINDIIKTGETGIIIEAYDIDGYVNEILHLMNDNNYIKNFEEDCESKTKEFLLENIGKQWENLFLSILNKK